MEIGENGHHGHHVHVLVVVLYKNHNVYVIVRSKSIDFVKLFHVNYLDRKMADNIVRVNQHEYDHAKIIP
jgi:hypothetical protein